MICTWKKNICNSYYHYMQCVINGLKSKALFSIYYASYNFLIFMVKKYKYETLKLFIFYIYKSIFNAHIQLRKIQMVNDTESNL